MISPSANSLRERAFKVGISQAALSTLAGLSQARVSRELSGLEPLQNTTINTLDQTLTALEKLVQLFPCPLDLRRLDEVKELLAKLQRGDIGKVIILPVTREAETLLTQARNLNAAYGS